ncbi:MAG: PHP domain-containing protein, partial [Clostridia bacterium]|nr:PHP domain-containing protein [Clostridia bacterium]
MKCIYDNDLHIHSKLSSCSNDEDQTTERILLYAKENNLKTICITDHFWDENVTGASDWYKPQNLAHISASLPL